MGKLNKRLDAHLVACAAAAGAATVGVTQTADAAIVYSGAVNLPIALTTNGLYLNVVTYPGPGSINEPGNTAGGTVPGWDINPYGSASLIMFNPAAPAGGVYVQRTGGGAPGNLAPGTVIGPASVYGAGTCSNIGNEPFVFNSSANIIGFRFQNEAAANQTQYGWFRVQLSTAFNTTRVLVEYAYDNTGGSIQAGAVPAPGSLALLALGALGVAGRRRK